MTRTQTITFNIGGQRYEISRSLLDQFPDTMLTKSASEAGLKDESEEIFIERDGSTFRHVLSYMRDGKVVLPVTEPKKSFVDELTYYGLEVRDEDIDHGRAQLQSYPFPIFSLLRKLTDELDRNILGQKLARFCVQEFFNGVEGTRRKSQFTLQVKDENDFLTEVCNTSNTHSIIQIANDHLSNVGLEVVSVVTRNGVTLNLIE